MWCLFVTHKYTPYKIVSAVMPHTRRTRYQWFWIRLSIARLIAHVTGLRVVSLSGPVYRKTIALSAWYNRYWYCRAWNENSGEKFQIQRSQPVWNLHHSAPDRSFLLCMPLRKSRDYSVVIYIRVSEAFLNIRSNAREKFGSTTRDLKFNSRHFYSTGIQGRCNNRSKLGHITD